MLVLVGCEESGVVRDAFIARGHDAYSNDLVPARRGGPHLQMDVMDALDLKPWDLIILHPECTCMCVAGNRTYGTGKPKHSERIAAVQWTLKLWFKAKSIARKGVALENPASVIFPHIRKYQGDHTIQYIQPYQFGHLEQKKTGLALDRLPPLQETDNVYAQMMALPKHQRERVFYMSPSATRSRDRSETYSGIAAAMASQWG